MSKKHKNNRHNIVDDWDTGNKTHQKRKIEAITKKSRSTGRQKFKTDVMDYLEDYDDEESVYNW